MKTNIYTRSLLLLAALSCGAFAAPLASSDVAAAAENRNGERSILISWNLMFTSDTTADGTSTVAGAFTDEASRHEDFSVTVNKSGTEATVTGTILIHGTKGDLTEQFTGRIPLGPDPITYVEGSGIFTGGTGAYAGVTGHATFEGTIDFATGKLVGITEGKIKAGR